MGNVICANSRRFTLAEAFAVCENYSPPEGFNPKDLHRLLEKVGSPSGVDDTGTYTLYIVIVNLCKQLWTRIFSFIKLFLNTVCLVIITLRNIILLISLYHHVYLTLMALVSSN